MARMGFAVKLIIVSAAIVTLTLVFFQQAQGAERKSPRLELKPEKITCGTKEYQGMRGTLYVPEDRTKPDSATIELPVIVVKSLSPNPDYPVFQFTGGPGISNINPGFSFPDRPQGNRQKIRRGVHIADSGGN
jgi:hypothetical protein